MLNTKQYFKQVDASLAVEELNNEVAAALGGGEYALQVYKDRNFQNLIGEFNFGPGRLPPKLDNQISSIKVNKGTRRFSDLPNWAEKFLILRPGKYPELGGFDFDFFISF
jgi:hypothetical protein